MNRLPYLLSAALAVATSLPAPPRAAGDDAPLRLTLRSRQKEQGKATVAVAERKAAWEPRRTALLTGDWWDDPWCRSAARRVNELAGPLNEAARAARGRGVFIIHAPSSVVSFYKDTPQRKRALAAPFAPTPVPLATAERWG